MFIAFLSHSTLPFRYRLEAKVPYINHQFLTSGESYKLPSIVIYISSSVANLVSEILDLVSPKDFGMT